MSFSREIEGEIAALRDAHLLRNPRVVSGAQGPTFRMNGRDVIGLCSNNYLGLADHPALADTMAQAARALGVGSGASRHISGSMDVHREAESALAAFVARPAALLFATGYAVNTGAIQGLMTRDDVIFSDALNHASLIDGSRLSRAPTHVYPHLDLGALRRLLRDHRAQGRKALIVTDAIFSMDGDHAPLKELRMLADEFDAGLMVDEAHSLGVFGPQGRGLCQVQGVVPDVLIGTLGKSFGISGAFAAGTAEVIKLIENRARSYVFSTAPSAPIAAVTTVATQLVEAADDRRTKVLFHAQRLRQGLRDFGYQVIDGDTPIVPVILGEPDVTMRISAALLEQGVFVHGIRPPTVPKGTSRLRIVPIATHSDEHIDQALGALADLRNLL
jgi:8-amino-7-oxononanoate synthase